MLNCLHINFSKLKTKNLEKMSAVYHEMFRFCEFTKIGKSNISFNLQLIRVNPSRSSFKWKYWNYNITPLIAPPNLGLKPFFNCHLNFYVVYALGVSPSFISRYCEDYRFWSIWGRVPLRTLHLKGDTGKQALKHICLQFFQFSTDFNETFSKRFFFLRSFEIWMEQSNLT